MTRREFPGVPGEPPTPRPKGGSKKAARDSVSGPRAAPPEFSKPGSIFTEEFKIELSAKTPGAKIRYTLDGSDPTPASTEYTKPITIAATTLVKAKSFEPGMAPSISASQTYTLLDNSLAEFSSNLPLVIINTFGQQISKAEPVTGSLRIIDPHDKRSSLKGEGDYDGRCDIKLRGYSSLRFPKHSFTVKIRADDGTSQKASILGFPGDSDWVLYAPYSDKTLMRDVLAYDLSNKMGRWAAHTRFVEVFVSRNGGKLTRRDYVGVYVLEEKIKRGKERVNIKKLTPDDNTEPAISGGYILKRDHTDPPGEGNFGMFGGNHRFASSGEYGFSTSRGLHLFYVEPKESEITPAQKAWLSQYLNRFESALYGPNFRSPSEGYAKYLDVDSFIDQFWIVELSKNVDGFRYSCFMSKDRDGKLRLEPIWDWNLSFGNANYHQGWTPESWYWPLIRQSEVCWFRRLRLDPDFVQRVTDRWAELRRTIFKPEALIQEIDEFADQLQEAQARNYQRWSILGQHVNPNYYVGDSFADEVNWMKSWIQERIAWIDGQFIPAPRITRNSSSSGAEGKVSLEGAAGTIYFTLDGSDPRAVGGGLSPQAHEYTESVAMDPGAKLFARCRAGEAWSAPAVTVPNVKAAATAH
jgi:hypothetical protein